MGKLCFLTPIIVIVRLQSIHIYFSEDRDEMEPLSVEISTIFKFKVLLMRVSEDEERWDGSLPRYHSAMDEAYQTRYPTIYTPHLPPLASIHPPILRNIDYDNRIRFS
ncbi:hypothetical protein WG66_009534 [Moniliophthora roreri]|nr:hypothetical protein WG66_009534 [Moniliophthora roreri]